MKKDNATVKGSELEFEAGGEGLRSDVEPEPDLDTHSDTITPAQAARLMGERRPVNKPDLSRLRDAFVDDAPQFRRGDRIAIERYASFLAGRPYLDTRTYRVVSIDPVTGRLELYDDSLGQMALDNWKHGMSIGQLYKLVDGVAVATRRKRGRPRKNPLAPPAKPALGPDGKPVKKKRGRPAGSKNRSKDAIREERAARRTARAAKKGSKS